MPSDYYDPPPPKDLTPSADARNDPAGAYRHLFAPVDVSAIANRLGVPKDTVHKWRHRGLLPDPDYPLAVGPVWEWSTIESWARETGRYAD